MLACPREIYSKITLYEMIQDMNKFSFAQMTSNTDGKTSGTGTMGILICTVGSLCFLLGCIDKMWITHTVDIITQSIVFVGIGVALMGYRKSQEKHLISTQDPSQEPVQDPPVQQLNS